MQRPSCIDSNAQPHGSFARHGTAAAAAAAATAAREAQRVVRTPPRPPPPLPCPISLPPSPCPPAGHAPPCCRWRATMRSGPRNSSRTACSESRTRCAARTTTPACEGPAHAAPPARARGAKEARERGSERGRERGRAAVLNRHFCRSTIPPPTPSSPSSAAVSFARTLLHNTPLGRGILVRTTTSPHLLVFSFHDLFVP